jgi:hypothetical protein
MRLGTLFAALACGLACASVSLAGSLPPLFKITEAYVGVDGTDGTQDWIEVTNFGAGSGDTGTLLYDDVNPVFANAGFMDSFILDPNESAIFLLDLAPTTGGSFTTAIDQFVAIWGPVANIGYTNGGGNLGQGGDTANIGLNNGGVFQLVDALEYTAAVSGQFATIEDPAGMGPVRVSVLGENGAYTSNPYDNVVTSPPSTTSRTFVGSPGAVANPAIPEPATVALAVLGLAAIALKRRS